MAVSQLERVMGEISTGEADLEEARTSALELVVSLVRAAREAGTAPPEVHELLWETVGQLSGALSVTEVRDILDETLPTLLNMLPPEELKGNREKVGRVIEYVNRNYYRQISLEEVSREVAFVSPSHLCRLFKRYMGMTFVEFLNFIRVEAAKALLRENSAPVKEIASMVGFTSPQYFAKVFRRHTGMSPLQYRYRHLRKKNTGRRR